MDRPDFVKQEHVGNWPETVSKKECPYKEPEPHLLGEFPMSCYRCHIYADS